MFSILNTRNGQGGMMGKRKGEESVLTFDGESESWNSEKARLMSGFACPGIRR
jgi:hypothetical protein